MKTTLSGKKRRRVTALLAQSGLAHWETVLTDLLDRWESLEDLTIGVDEGPQAETVGLLRALVKKREHGDADPTDIEFARAVSGLGFLDYRVYRARGRTITETLWDPRRETLAQFRLAGAVAAYPDPVRPIPAPWLAAYLLMQVHGDQ